MITLDPILLARIQFAFTVSFHIVFPAFTIGLASFLAVLEWRWLKTNNKNYLDTYQFLVKIFAVAFGMGVVSGVVMSYEFGTNWSVFSDKIANVLGPLLGYEVLTAFFLEASFLGIMLFGWGRVSKRMHFASTCIVAVGTLISAFWILAANSWMQTPQGFQVGEAGRYFPLDWLQIIFNPSFPYRLAHMVTAAYLTTAFVVGGIGAFYLWNKRHLPQAKIMLGMATLMTALASPLQLVIGDLHGLNTLKYQPAKIAAMEGIWDNEKGAGLRLFALPSPENETNHYEIIVPHLTSLILTHHYNGEVQGLKSFSKEDRPPVLWVFFGFRIMVGLGVLMILLSLASAVQYYRNKLFDSRFLQASWMLMMPSGFLAVLAGWFVNEVGRQPYTVYGLLRTAESVSPAITGHQVGWSLLAFVLMYTLVFGAGSYYILKLIRKGIPAAKEDEQYYKHGTEASVVEGLTHQGESHV
ncbi:MAG: cytochrome ubiquinol oxidase subunit I [Tatlockia sp.]|jgi:cytochrome d ubiquinol oxidase subunit I